MLGVGMGCATRDRTVAFASAFACFLSRGYDQIRMGAISQTKLKMAGSHVGVSIGKLRFLYSIRVPLLFQEGDTFTPHFYALFFLVLLDRSIACVGLDI